MNRITAKSEIFSLYKKIFSALLALIRNIINAYAFEKIIKEKKLSESLLYEQMAGFQAWVVDNFGKFMKEGEKEQ